MAYTSPYHMVASGSSTVAVHSPIEPPATFSTSQHQLAYQQAHNVHHQQQQQQQQQLQKIMKADEDVRMVSAETPVIFAKACEMFILELTLRSWINVEENKRRTLQKNDIAACHFKD
ncbi:Nuclear transcription factor Y subunit C-2 [Camellia lanceoleosa]|uniref:Nuclear transcription factor Y subunit C-2 n=1 Tax=Camellia lanceoleosa TaxID=1840588 RepID=A0ACC0I9R7_9ERIC|nr:Nuclear transcription factor Y subunit C-2 [Camellia lanceoleosa]